MFEKIVLATDLSSDWDRIIGCADELRALGCTRTILTHVIISKGLVGADAVAQSEAQPRLEAQKKQLEAQGFEVIVETPLGLPAFSLNEVADRHCASLILVGSHGKSAWREAILGSVSNAVLHHARFPILLINVKRLREERREGSCQLRATELVRHVLFPTDFSQVADEAAAYLEYQENAHSKMEKNKEQKQMAKSFVAVRILDLPGAGGGCACGSSRGLEQAILNKGKSKELMDALAANYPGQASMEYFDLTDSPELKETEAGQLLVTGKYPPPIVIIDGEPRFAGSIQINKIMKEVGKILNG